MSFSNVSMGESLLNSSVLSHVEMTHCQSFVSFVFVVDLEVCFVVSSLKGVKKINFALIRGNRGHPFKIAIVCVKIFFAFSFLDFRRMASVLNFVVSQ